MKERPILFSSEMVRAILAGRKTQTRRVLKPYPCGYEPSLNKDGLWEFCCESHFENDEPKIHIFKCPYGKIGDQLWVRETWSNMNERENDFSADILAYRADETAQYISAFSRKKMNTFAWNWDHKTIKWKPSIFMPRWASRIQLEITGIRVERVQDITREDAIAEGIFSEDFYPDDGYPLSIGYTYVHGDVWKTMYPKPEGAFQALWDSINAKRGYSWDDEPWVWVIEFKRKKP